LHLLPGEYSSTIITKSVQILADGGQASISSSSSSVSPVSAAIVINAGATDVVKIRGLITNRHGSLAAGGIGFVAGKALHLENCTLVNAGANWGVHFAPAGDSELTISNCTIANNGGASGGGVLVRPQAGATGKVVISNSRITNNRDGLIIFGGSDVLIRHSTISGSENRGIRSVEADASVRVADSTISGNQVGLQIAAGSIISHGGNVVADNTVNGTFSSTIAQQ
jgi:hypothetical protein